jgi:hypothetical protein
LKPEYRGEVQASKASKEEFAYALSDMGADKAGSKNNELPEEIIIPEMVNEMAVTALAYAMFCGNKRIKRLVLPVWVKEIPEYFCYNAWNLKEVLGTDAVEVLNTAAFAQSGIVSAKFPGLKQLNGINHFVYCADLVVADLGSTITEVPTQALAFCERLTHLRNGSAITAIGQSGFLYTRRLRTLSFLPNLTSIGNYGALCSRVVYDWDSLTNCAFGTLSTAKDFCGEDYWSGCTFTPCSVPLRSTFEQNNPLWADEAVGSIGKTWKDCCIIVDAAMAYSILEGKDLSSPAEFTNAVYAADPGLMDVNPTAVDEGVERYLEAVGYNVTHYGQFNAANMQALYDALADGALVIWGIRSGYSASGHAVLVYGVNDFGELLCVDSVSFAEKLGRYEAATYPMSVQNLTRIDEDEFWVVHRN